MLLTNVEARNQSESSQRMYSTITALLAIISCLARVSSSESSEPFDFPAPNGKSNRILSMVVAFTLSRMDPLLLTMRGHQSMCESGWDVQFTIFTAQKVSPRMRSYLERKLYCYRIEAPIPLVISVHDPAVGFHLVEETKPYMKRVWMNFDLIMYMEEDVIVDHSHVSAYLAETKKLQALLGKEEADKYYVGFQRYRRHLLPMERMRSVLTEEEVLNQEYLEEIPFLKPICLHDKPYMQAVGSRHVPGCNVYQAMWMLTKDQVLGLQKTCHFLDLSFAEVPKQRQNYVRVYLGSLSILENDILSPNCGLQKIIPAGHLLDFGLWHYYYTTKPSMMLKTHPLFATHEHIQAGLLQTSEFLAFAGHFDNLPCWAPIVEKHRAAMNLTIDADSVAILQHDNELLVLKNGTKHHIRHKQTLDKYGYDKLTRYNAKNPLFDTLPLGADIQ